MRSLSFVLCGVLLAACSRSTKPAVRTAAPSGAADRSSTTSDQPRGDATLQTSDGDDLSWLAPVYFEFDSADLSASARDTLTRLHDWLTQHPKVALTIEGHCDQRGTTEYNIGLGQRRAQAIADYLGRLGTATGRLRTISYGAERPAVEGSDDIAYAKNRRGELDVAR